MWMIEVWVEKLRLQGIISQQSGDLNSGPKRYRSALFLKNSHIFLPGGSTGILKNS